MNCENVRRILVAAILVGTIGAMLPINADATPLFPTREAIGIATAEPAESGLIAVLFEAVRSLFDKDGEGIELPEPPTPPELPEGGPGDVDGEDGGGADPNGG